MSDFVEDMARMVFETSARMAREDADAVLSYYEMSEEEREKYDKQVMKALLETMNDGMTTAQRVLPIVPDKLKTLDELRSEGLTDKDRGMIKSEEVIGYSLIPMTTKPFLYRGSVWTPAHGQPTVFKLQELYKRREKAPE